MTTLLTGFGGGGSGSTTTDDPATDDPHIDVDARLDIQTLDERLQDIALEAGRTVIVDGTGFALGYQWRNETDADITVPASPFTVADLEAAGLTKDTQGNIAAPITGPTTASFATVGTSSNVANVFENANNSTGIFHIKLPFGPGIRTGMYHLKAEGYGYGLPMDHGVIDVTWVGYSYTTGHLKYQTHVTGSDHVTAGQYVGSDGYIYLWLKPSNTYYTSFAVTAMHVGNGRVLTADDVAVTFDSTAEL